MASIPVRPLNAPFYHRSHGDFYLAQYVAPLAGELSVYCSYQLKATNENNWALMRGWVNSGLEYSGYDTIFSNAHLTWTDHHPMSQGSGVLLLVQQNNKSADPTSNKSPIVDFSPRRATSKPSLAEELVVDKYAPASKSRYDERIDFRQVEALPSIYAAQYVAPMDGNFDVDYFVQLSATDQASQAETLIWVNGDLVYNPHDEGFTSIPFEYKTQKGIKQGEIFTVLIYEWNLNANPSNQRMRARFSS